MRIDLFAVWFMNGLLGQSAELSAGFAMASSATPPAPDLMRAVVVSAAAAAAGYAAEANSI
jgi:hypothetical protein